MLCSQEVWERFLGGCVEGRPDLVSADGPYGPASLLARRTGWMFHDARRGAARPRSLGHLHAAHAYVLRLRDWLDRFRGVATRYLPNYLTWHRTVDARWRHRLRVRALRWPVGGGPG